jgi:endonuclease YncB( thermonuclease family)
MAKVPNTISDKQYADLQKRARTAALPMFSKKAVQGRLASNAQQKKAGQS